MPLKCTGKVTKTLKMAEDSRQAPTESNKITVVLHSKKQKLSYSSIKDSQRNHPSNGEKV